MSFLALCRLFVLAGEVLKFKCHFFGECFEEALLSVALLGTDKKWCK